MKALIGALILLSPLAEAQNRMGPYVPVPRVKLDPKSPTGTTDNPNLRCTAKVATDGNVVVEFKVKKGFTVNGVNLTISDESGDVVSALLAPQTDGEWVSYRFTIRRASLDSALIDVYAPEESGRLFLRGLPIRSNKENGESGRREVLTPAPHTTGHTDP